MTAERPAGRPASSEHRPAVRTVVVVAVAMVSIAVAVSAPAIVSGRPADAATDTSAFVPVGPLRLADTRSAPCACRRIDGFTIRVAVGGRLGIPRAITAAAITVTATNVGAGGSVTAYPAGTPAPPTSILNPRAGADAANSAIVAVGANGAIDVRSTVQLDVGIEVIVDVAGVFVPDDRARAGRFRVVEPTRIGDTRTTDGPDTGLEAGSSISLPLPAGIDTDATALAINVTTVDAHQAGFVSVRPAATASAIATFMTTDGSGRTLAASVIAPVSPGGLVITTTGGGHLIVDLVGWFTGRSAPESADGLFVTTAARRLLDSRRDQTRVWPGGTLELAVDVRAAAIVTNVTIERTDGTGFVTAYAAGTQVPAASTINAVGVDDTASNFAITPISDRGSAYYSDGGTDLIVDVAGHFTGTPRRATVPARPNVQPPSRTLLVGDSTLAGVRWHRATDALRDFPYEFTAESCRRLATASCRGREGYAPSNAVTAIRRASGRFATVVVMTGYNDWWTVFPTGFDKVVAAARDKGARTIVWLTYRESVRYHGARSNDLFARHNQTLRDKLASGLFPDVVLADWDSYTATTSGWLASDGVHFSRAGSYAAADYISRKLAFLEDRACPMPWEPGAAVDAPCPDPDVHGPVSDVTALYG